MSASIQIFVSAWMYNFLLSENSVSSELLENLHVDHKRFTQSKVGVVTFDFKLKLGSTFVQEKYFERNFVVSYSSLYGQRI